MDPRDFLTVAVLLFAIGVSGFLTRRNLIVVFLSIELMLNAGALALLTFARVWGDASGHVLFFLVIALAAAESAVGLSLLVALYRRRHAVDTGAAAELRG
jgi:NADH-quinone oxidoreductase subunit K